jgi:hypothetical protein
MPDERQEYWVTRGFCEQMTRLHRTAFSVIARPDQSADGCDAIVGRAGEQWALDHTKIESFG